MSKFQLINGWTKEKVLEQFKKKNNGTVSKDSIICSYKTLDGNHCAVGAFIPDEAYSLSFEKNPVNDLLSKYPHLTSYMPLDRKGLTAMQCAHDQCNYIPYTYYTNGDTYKAIEQFLNNEVE